MSTNEIRRAPIIAAAPPSTPRLVLTPARAGHAVLDGGWWPRSWDPVAELPGLVLALSDRYGPIRQLMLNSVAWGGGFRRLAVGTAVVRMGWFASLDPAILIATTNGGDQLDILVVPPQSAPDAANLAMTGAADPADTRRAPDILAATPTAALDPANNPDANAVWDNEGGYISTSRPPRPTKAAATAILR
jgi:hypothetical protein